MNYIKPEIKYGTVEKIYACKGGTCNGPTRPSTADGVELCVESDKKNTKEAKVA